MNQSLLASFQPELVIFDKDGTLIDLHFMWGRWVEELAARLEAASGCPVREALFHTYGYDGARGRARADSLVAITPMSVLRSMAMVALREAGCPEERVGPAVATAWHAPDPLTLARPLADLRALFEALRAGGARIAVATADERQPTHATLESFGVADLVDDLSCGDDGLPTKPAPDAVLALCRGLGISPARAAVIGDTVADLQMGRTAGAGLVLGVLSGAGASSDLAPYADHLIESVASLL